MRAANRLTIVNLVSGDFSTEIAVNNFVDGIKRGYRISSDSKMLYYDLGFILRHEKTPLSHYVVSANA